MASSACNIHSLIPSPARMRKPITIAGGWAMARLTAVSSEIPGTEPRAVNRPRITPKMAPTNSDTHESNNAMVGIELLPRIWRTIQASTQMMTTNSKVPTMGRWIRFPGMLFPTQNAATYRVMAPIIAQAIRLIVWRWAVSRVRPVVKANRAAPKTARVIHPNVPA